MEMEFVGLLKVIWRWLWLIILIVAATCLILYFNPSFNFVGYRADVTLLFSTPDREDVSAFDDYVFTNERDEVSIAMNKFIEIANYPEVRARTLADLGISENYDLDVSSELGADFVYITVIASKPELAAAIANSHAENARLYYGEIRALTANQALDYFDDELLTAQQELSTAEVALNIFQIENGVVLLDRELELQYSVLEQLEIARAQLLVAVASGVQVRSISNVAGELSQTTVINFDIADIDALITAQREDLANLAALEPEYNRLLDDVTTARERYEFLTSQAENIETRESFSGEAMFIQVIQAAEEPESPEDNKLRTLALGAVGSLGFSILLAFILDYLLKKW